MLCLLGSAYGFSLGGPPRAAALRVSAASAVAGSSATFLRSSGVLMVDDPEAKKAAAEEAKAAAVAKKEAAKAEKAEGEGEESADEAAAAAAEAEAEAKKKADEEAKKKAAEEAKKKAAAEAKAKADAKAAAEKAEAIACFSDKTLVLTTVGKGQQPASVNERADALRTKGLPEATIKAALTELGMEEIPYQRDYFGNIMAPVYGSDGKPVYSAAQRQAGA